MRLIAVPLPISALIASMAFGQTSADPNLHRIFHFTHGETALVIQETATLLGGIAGVRQTSLDAAQESLEVSGTAAQLAIAEWLCSELDNPSHAEHRVPGGADDVVRVFDLPYTPTPQTFQQVATLVRSIADIRRMFTINESRAAAVRGTSSQLALAEWLFGEMDKPAAPLEYHMPDGVGDNSVRVFYLARTLSMQDFQQAVSLVRSTAEIRRVYTYNEPRALVVRGTSAQVALAEWLFNELDSPTMPHEYPLPVGRGEQVRVFYLAQTSPPETLHRIAAEIRSTPGAPQIFAYDRQKALAARGSADEIARAEKLVRDGDK